MKLQLEKERVDIAQEFACFALSPEGERGKVENGRSPRGPSFSARRVYPQKVKPCIEKEKYIFYTSGAGVWLEIFAEFSKGLIFPLMDAKSLNCLEKSTFESFVSTWRACPIATHLVIITNI